MATAVISLLKADDPSSTLVNIVDTDTNINALWVTASTLVNGYMDFTSIQAGLYARYAQGYTDPVLTDAGLFTGKGTVNGGQTFTTGDAPPGFVGDYLPEGYTIASNSDTEDALALVSVAVNNLIRNQINSSIGRVQAS